MAGRLDAPRAGRRRTALLALAGAVIGVHGWLTSVLADRMVGFLDAPQAMPPRIEVAYVRELEAAAPPSVAPVVAPLPPSPAPRLVRRAKPAEAAASEASAEVPPAVAVAALEPASGPPAEPTATPVTEDLAASAAASPAIADAVDAVAAAPAASFASLAPVAAEAAPASLPLAAASASGAASGAAGFEWPVSTRLSYQLSGYFRGELHGDAQVEWVRSGSHYQVHLDVSVGPSVAPLFSRRMTSDGDITAEGLSPRRWDQDSKVAFASRQRVTLLFEDDAVVLANGERRPRLAGVQDMASQFVQLSFLFTTHPELLRSGNRIEMPLALPRRVERWIYDVLEAETLDTPAGALATFHLKPRREAGPAAGDLVMETWYAPTLRYLPVRIRIQQNAETYFDLMLSRRPELAGPP